MKILALEFSSPRRSVAVLDGKTVLAERAEDVGQTVPPLDLIEQALVAAKVGRAQIECVAVGLGPGSYTGIRGAIALAQGWRLATGARLVGVSSVECLAKQAQVEGYSGRANIVLDAQRGDIYRATYEISDETIKNTVKLSILSLSFFKNERSDGVFILGPEVNRWFSDARVVYPSAGILGGLVEFGSVVEAELEPIYLRETSFVKAPPLSRLSTL